MPGTMDPAAELIQTYIEGLAGAKQALAKVARQ
jgi:hypothetical protein